MIRRSAVCVTIETENTSKEYIPILTRRDIRPNSQRAQVALTQFLNRRIAIGRSWSCTACLVLLLHMALPLLADEKSSSDAEELFAHRVLPVFKSKCFVCHGDDPKDVRGAFNMHSREGLLRGGESEEASLVPGKPEKSPLYRAVKWDGIEMPPKENDRLTAKQIDDLRGWILGGAPWPNDERLAEILRTTSKKWNVAKGIPVATSGGLSDDWTKRKYLPENLWAYQPLWQDGAGLLAEKSRNPIDILIGDQMRELELTPAPLADRRTLIRRATFDLLGLPPSPEAIDEFINDPATDDEAFEKVVERLLASPHYGEQFGRHWLDVVRYADSSGYANDYERGNAWRYRDYVVRSFNADKPYDQFVREQIAGDEIDAANPEMLVAVGFLRMGPWELTGMEVPKVARQRFLDDVTDAVGQVFLGHMLQCARCHDHKFDPIPTRDYYSIQAVFGTTQLVERDAEFLPTENTKGFEEKKYLQQRMRFYKDLLVKLKKKQTLDAARRWYAENKINPAEFEKTVVELANEQLNKQPDLQAVRTKLAKLKVDPATIPPRHVGFTPLDFGLERIARKGMSRLVWRMDRYEPIALSVYSGRTPQLKSVYAPLRMPQNRMKAGELEETCILAGGDPFSPKQPVVPGVLSVVNQTSRRLPDDEIEGRRLGLANWIASKDNPLTARVMVNRLWQWHFGRAIAGNPNNFGTTGKKPTHPELLDFLAGRFVKNDWSIKAMHRLIMNSATYRRSSDHPDSMLLSERHSNGESYAVFPWRRLDAEELRDAMLFVSGELNRDLGGIPIRPEMNLEAALQPRQVMGTFAEAWQPSPLPEQRHRRSIYALRLRGQRDPFYEVFNAPSPDISCEAREASIVTPQVFAMFNSEATFSRALALASRLTKGEPSREKVIQRLFTSAYGRAGDPVEVKACLEHWKTMAAKHDRLTFTLPNYPEEVVREAVEENTGEKFSFVEPLEFYQDFVPDLKPSDVNANLRGLAEVCLVVLNSNEFAYVY